MSYNVVMGIPSKRNRLADPYNNREVIVIESNVGQHSNNRISISNALAEKLNLGDDNAFISLVNFESKEDGKIVAMHFVPVSGEQGGFRITKKNGTKPRTFSDKKLHGFLCEQLLDHKGELPEDRSIGFQVLEGDSKPSELSSFGWVLKLLPSVPSTVSNKEPEYENVSVEQEEKQEEKMPIPTPELVSETTSNIESEDEDPDFL